MCCCLTPDETSKTICGAGGADKATCDQVVEGLDECSANATASTSNSNAPLQTTNIGVIIAMSICGGVLALLMAVVLAHMVRKEKMADEHTKQGKQMMKIAKVIQDGAKSFLVTEYKYLAGFCAIFGIILLIIFTTTPVKGGNQLDGVRYMGCFLTGALLSASAGWYGMVIATDSNVRTAHAAECKGLPHALKVAFMGGSVMGFTVVGLGITGLSIFFVLMTLDHTVSGFSPEAMSRAFQYLTGFGFGASSIALFARVAGGIYTKAADVGADLVGKVEEDLNEDHPNNPAVIADNVGDNVGDVAGMGADLFESYVGSIIAAGSLADVGDTAMLAYPFWIAGSGIVAAAIGAQCVRINTKPGAPATQKELMRALGRGVQVSSLLVIIFSAIITWAIFNSEIGWKRFGCVLIGLVSGVLIGEAPEYFRWF
jgi:H(+)-translocating pyrophosphatase